MHIQFFIKELSTKDANFWLGVQYPLTQGNYATVGSAIVAIAIVGGGG